MLPRQTKNILRLSLGVCNRLKGSDNLPYEKIGKEVRCIAEEVPFEIPESWEWVRLGNIFQHNTGKALNSSNNNGITKEYITTSNLYWNEFKLDNLREMYFSSDEIKKYTVQKGDLLVCEGGDVGRAAIWEYNYGVCIQNHIHKLTAYDTLCIKFFYYLFYLYKNTGLIGGKGIGIKGLSSNALHILLFPIPPLPEQERIVSKIEELMPLVEEYNKVETKNNELNIDFPDKLKKSILQDAVQGKLVPQNPNDEPASVLIEQIRKEKEQLIKEKKIKKDKNESYIFRRDNSYYEKFDEKEVCIDDKIPFDIPNNWTWTRLGTILIKLTDGTHSTPKYTTTGVPFLSVKDMSNGVLDFSNTKFISAKEHDELYKRCNPEFGDLLLTKVGTTGIPVVVDTEKEFSLFVSVALLKFNQNLIYNEYLKFLILSPLVQLQAKENTKGVGNKNWVMRDIANTLIAIPPLAEQYRIVEKLKNTFESLNKLHL